MCDALRQVAHLPNCDAQICSEGGGGGGGGGGAADAKPGLGRPSIGALSPCGDCGADIGKSMPVVFLGGGPRPTPF